MLMEDQLYDTVSLIVANRQFLPIAASVAEMTQKLGLINICNRQ